MGTTLALLLIVIPSIFSAHSSLQQEVSIQNMGNILVQDNFAETIFFEYGAETGIIGTQIGLQPPWDSVTYGWPIEVDDTYARGGSKSIYIKVTPSGEEGVGDSLRRAFVEESASSHGQQEFYWSWWVYFDDVWANDEPDGSYGGRVGDIQIWMRAEGTSGYRWWGVRFGIEPDGNREIYVSWVEHKFPLTTREQWDYDSGKYLQGSGHWRNTWIQFQLYIKMSTDPEVGKRKAWIYNSDTEEEITVMDETGITDPTGYDRWDDDNFYFTLGSSIGGDDQVGSYPFGPCLYTDYENQHEWIWVDDCVAATEKVPHDYRVVEK
jgi:hypothetical protein